MTITQIQYFVAVAEELSVTKVANEFHVSQPAVSYAIRDLEKSYNVTLFLRGTSGLKLTPEGIHIYNQAKDLLNHYHQFEGNISNTLDKRNSFSIGFAPNISSPHIAGLTKYVSENYPDITLNTREAFVKKLKQQLNYGTLDAVCFSIAHNDLDNININKCCVSEFVMYFYVHKKLLDLQKTELTVDDISHIPIATQPKGTGLNSLITRVYEENDTTANILCESEQLTTIKDFVKEGLSGAYLSSLAFYNENCDDIRHYSVKGITAKGKTDLYWKTDVPGIDSFVSIVKQYFKQFAE